MKIRVIQYDGNYDYTLEIQLVDGTWISIDLNKEAFQSLKDKVNMPEQHPSYGN